MRFRSLYGEIVNIIPSQRAWSVNSYLYLYWSSTIEHHTLYIINKVRTSGVDALTSVVL